MNSSAANFNTVVTTCTEPMFLAPDRFTAAITHRPANTRRTEPSRLCPLFTNSSTYSTHPTAIAALPAHAVIQYDHAFAKPRGLPNAAREYAYGPPSAGSRRDNAANITANASAPTVVRPIDTRLIGP